VGGVERRSAVRDFRGTVATAPESFLLLTELLLGSMSLSPRKASRHLHLQHRRFEDPDADPADEDDEDVAAPMDNVLLLRLRQQLLLLLLLETDFGKNNL